MKFCQEHWDKVRAAIKARGLDHLVAKSGEEAHTNLKAELRGEKADFDPLMSCHWMITSKAVELGGLYMMTRKEDGTDYCPVCEALAHECGDESYWIDGPADAILKEARERGLVPGVQ